MFPRVGQGATPPDGAGFGGGWGVTTRTFGMTKDGQGGGGEAGRLAVDEVTVSLVAEERAGQLGEDLL